MTPTQIINDPVLLFLVVVLAVAVTVIAFLLAGHAYVRAINHKHAKVMHRARQVAEAKKQARRRPL